MRGVEHFAHKSSSVVVLVIHQDCVFTLERKRQSPISVHLDRPVSGQITLQRTPVRTRNIHFECALCCIQQLQLKLESRGMLRLDPRLRFGLEKPLNPVTPEAPYHSYSATLRYTQCKRLGRSNTCQKIRYRDRVLLIHSTGVSYRRKKKCSCVRSERWSDWLQGQNIPRRCGAFSGMDRFA